MSEKELVERYCQLRDSKDDLNEKLSSVESELKQVESDLIDLLTDEGKTATAKYEGIGYVSIEKPKIKVNVKKEYTDKLLEFIRENDRAMIIKENVHHSNLESFVSELLEAGKQIPDFIGIYYKQVIKRRR